MATATDTTAKPRSRIVRLRVRPSQVQRQWLQRGLGQPGGKLPLFDADGKRVESRTVRSCIDQGWATPWFANPLKPDWLVCKLTPLARTVLAENSS